jgi:hypothetical protein
VRSDQAQYEALNENLALQKHVIKSYAVWDIPGPSSGLARAILNDWQLSGILTAGSGYQPGAIQANGAAQANCALTNAPAGSGCANGRYDIPYTYQNNGTNTNLTGSPDYAAKIIYVGDPGSGCSDNQYAQFNTASVKGPTYGSVGLESSRYVLGGCTDHTVDLAIAKNIKIAGNKSLQFRWDVYNVFNAVIYNNRNSNVIYRSPTDQTIVNSQYLPDGTVDPTRLQPKNAGFGAATSAQPLRNSQLQIRFIF